MKRNKVSSKKSNKGALITLGVFALLIIGSIIMNNLLGGGDNRTTAGSASLKDGVYEATSGPDQYGAYTGIYSKIKITVTEGKITDVVWSADPEDSIKGKDAMRGAKQYASMLIKRQEVGAVDAVSGASMFSYKVFVKLANEALKKAKE